MYMIFKSEKNPNRSVNRHKHHQQYSNFYSFNYPHPLEY